MKTRMTKQVNNAKLLLALLPLFLLVGVSSCSKGEVYYKFQELKEADWPVEQVLTFEIDSLSIEKGVPYDISLEITNNVDYPYQNFWLFSEYYKNDTTVVKDEREFILADEFGKWKGSGFASLYQSSHLISKSIKFPERKNYVFYVRHGMKDEVLHGIEKIGVKIVKVEN